MGESVPEGRGYGGSAGDSSMGKLLAASWAFAIALSAQPALAAIYDGLAVIADDMDAF